MTEVELGPYRLGIATEFGPRIVSLRRDDGPELLARLGSDSAIEYPGGTFHFHGGHRLWASPEIPEITYANDDHDCQVEHDGWTVSVVAPADSAGLVKTIEIDRDGDDLRVTHTITGPPESRPLAAWAITQFPLGGSAVVPIEGSDTGARPNRNMVLWPYTELDDDRLRFGRAMVAIDAHDGPALKIGVGPAPKRLGYLREGWLFVKEAPPTAGGDVPDFGAAGQVYVGQGFCELESVGELVDLGRRTASLVERWRVIPCLNESQALESILGGETR